jgi:hypothetical protein
MIVAEAQEIFLLPFLQIAGKYIHFLSSCTTLAIPWRTAGRSIYVEIPAFLLHCFCILRVDWLNLTARISFTACTLTLTFIFQGIKGNRDKVPK